MKTKIEQHPEFSRATSAIEEAIAQTQIEGGDMRSLASCMLSLSAGLYRSIHGSTGPDGLPIALAKLVASEAQREAQDFEQKRYGASGRA
ncbi:hypothetical protein KPG71_04685 [Roseovarius sp. PS-C2]|uniref:hypothetical protein n=1 Tax=Roseovarius sp. PS-C2 TaxID=2820814 RepID=UPI001C0C0003|nr:hypothetical protein [Roseovarius sp. PS-C2]MBU3259306.1 hypothetical protein [Roseovarius sp. PS-C2]